MTTVPDRSRVRLPGISSRAYEHPADRTALTALRKLTGFDTILKNLAGLFNDRAFRLSYLASSVRASEQQFPQLYQMMLDGAYILDLPRIPELYISQNPQVNAMALGMDKPFIVIYSGAVELWDSEEMRFVIGHELGHVLSGHAVYRTMLLYLTNLAARLALVPFAWLGLKAVIWGLEEWHRKSELSCDRAGLLAGQDIEAARRALMKMAGGSRLNEFSSDAFHQQAREYDAVPDLRESLIKLLQLQGQTHPFAVIRFAELDRWASGNEYRDILAGNYPRRGSDSDSSLGDEFKGAAKSYQDSWNRSADPLIGMVRGAAGTAADVASGIFDRLGGRRNDED
jgi:Zn-dependent protease with chaperone function